MKVILALKGVCKPHKQFFLRNSLLIIKMERSSNECVGGPPGANISDVYGWVTAPGLKALASVDNISGSRSNGWGKFVGPRRLLGKVGRNLVV